MPNRLRLVAPVVAALLLGAAAKAPRRAPQGGGPIVVLVSLDGFRWDFLERYPTPNLHRLAERGVRARWMAPVFPTLTFPNHYSIITGLLPAHHGIVSNQFLEPVTGRRFRYTDTLAMRDSSWWGGEPLWVTAERQGRRSASFFWPGSEAAIGGVRPSRWLVYDGQVPWTARAESSLAWLQAPEPERPAFVTVYWSGVDEAEHRFGPEAPEALDAVASADSLVGRLLDGLTTAGLARRVNLVVVSDHGSAATSRDRVVLLDDYVDVTTVDLIRGGQALSLRARDGDDARLFAALRRVPHVAFYRRAETPARWRYRDNDRIAPIVGQAEAGWTITTRQLAARRFNLGEHGYDDTVSAMRGIFVAAGPAFREGVVTAPFRNVHVYEPVCAILGLRPALNDGSLDSVRVMLRGARD